MTQEAVLKFLKDRHNKFWRQMVCIWWSCKTYPVGYPQNVVAYLEDKRVENGIMWLRQAA